MTTNIWIYTALISATMVAWGAVADFRRSRRKDLNRVGFMPWSAITMLAVLATVISCALVLKSA